MNESSSLYAQSGVDTEAGDLAVELMKSAVLNTHSANVLGGVGGFAGLYDASFLLNYEHPILATSTDGVGTKVAIAQQLDKHDTIGQDLVAMVVDDIVVVGAKPLFMTDYIACGKLYPERIASIVKGIADACKATGTALVGGETAEHPGLLGPEDYDVAGAATGVVEKSKMLGPELVQDGDVVLAMAASGLHSNGFSLVRKIMSDAGLGFNDFAEDFGMSYGEALLEPTMLYTGPLLRVLEGANGKSIHSLSHVTGGGIAANLARVLPMGSSVELDRSSWSPLPVFRHLADLAGHELQSFEHSWNMGIGMLAVVAQETADRVSEELNLAGMKTWRVGTVDMKARDLTGFEQGAKGVSGGAVRLVSNYSSS